MRRHKRRWGGILRVDGVAAPGDVPTALMTADWLGVEAAYGEEKKKKVLRLGSSDGDSIQPEPIFSFVSREKRRDRKGSHQN